MATTYYHCLCSDHIGPAIAMHKMNPSNWNRFRSTSMKKKVYCNFTGCRKSLSPVSHSDHIMWFCMRRRSKRDTDFILEFTRVVPR